MRLLVQSDGRKPVHVISILGPTAGKVAADRVMNVGVQYSARPPAKDAKVRDARRGVPPPAEQPDDLGVERVLGEERAEPLDRHLDFAHQLAVDEDAAEHGGNRFLGRGQSLDGGELDRAFDFTVHEKLLLEEVRKGSEERVTPWAEKLLDSLIVGQSVLKLFLSLERLDGSKQLIDFDNQIVKG